MRSLYFLFAWRYFKAKKSTNAINIIAWISIVAIVIGTAALILVLGVFNGFEGLVKTLYSSFYPDINVSPRSGKTIVITQQQLQQLRALPGVRNYSLVVEERAMLQNGDYRSMVSLKGVDDNYQYVSGVAAHLIRGEYSIGTADDPGVLLGAGVENALGVQADRNLLALNVFLGRNTNSELLDPTQNISQDSIYTKGTFVIQQDFDNRYAITNVDFVKRMLGLDSNQYGAIEIAIADPGNADRVKPDIAKIFGDYNVQTRYEQNRGLYSIMRAERWIIYAILTLLMIVFSFTLVSSLTMLVIEKQKDIAILHSFGGGKRFVQKIFLSEGLLLGTIGGVLGMLLAALLTWIQLTFKIIPLQAGSFLIDYFPVQLKIEDFILVGFTVLIIALLASWVPSRKAAVKQFSLRSE